MYKLVYKQGSCNSTVGGFNVASGCTAVTVYHDYLLENLKNVNGMKLQYPSDILNIVLWFLSIKGNRFIVIIMDNNSSYSSERSLSSHGLWVTNSHYGCPKIPSCLFGAQNKLIKWEKIQTTSFKCGRSFNYLQINVIWATCQAALIFGWGFFLFFVFFFILMHLKKEKACRSTVWEVPRFL